MAKQCSVDGCERNAEARGWCHAHLLRWIRLGSVLADRPIGRRVNTICSVVDCGRPATKRQLCQTHATRQRRSGDARANDPIKQTPGTGYVHHGYFCVPVPSELRHLVDGKTNALEHRLVMAQILGRPLTADESVHHRNGNRLDNRKENLELWSRWQPRGQRVTDKVAWAVEVLEQYAPERLAKLE
jgi:hypothetical protein